MSNDAYTPEVMARVVEYALAAGSAAQANPSGGIMLGEGATAQYTKFTPGGWCLMFVRQVYETALQIEPFAWRYATSKAKYTLALLEDAGHRLGPGIVEVKPGDILGHRRGSAGHIGIYVGSIGAHTYVAENTSSTSRGNPRRAGTKLTPYGAFSAGGIEHYRLAAATIEPTPDPVRIKVVQLGGGILAEYDMHPDGNHIADQGKIYVYGGE